MHKILLVEDNLDIQDAVVQVLGGECAVSIASTIKDAKALLSAVDFDLVLLDVELPDGEGFKVCSFMQEDQRLRHVNVIFLTGRGEVDDKVHAFALGADDYIMKPFGARELKARVMGRILKRDAAKRAAREFRIGDLRFELDTHRLYVTNADNRELALDVSSLEFKLLYHFARHEDHILTRQQIMGAVWGEQLNVSDRTVDSHISKLRRKMASSSCRIAAVHGEGYRFTASSRNGTRVAG